MNFPDDHGGIGHLRPHLDDLDIESVVLKHFPLLGGKQMKAAYRRIRNRDSDPGFSVLRLGHSPTHCECDTDGDNPNPFSISDFRFSITKQQTERCGPKCFSHSLSPNLKSAIENLKCHLMTRSARASTFGGIVRPICFAVFRFMMNSNFVGCSTGRSAGLTPFNILPCPRRLRRAETSPGS